MDSCAVSGSEPVIKQPLSAACIVLKTAINECIPSKLFNVMLAIEERLCISLEFISLERSLPTEIVQMRDSG